MVTERILTRLVRALVGGGTLDVVLANGTHIIAGDGDGPKVVARFADAKAQRELLRDPELKFGELFTDGRLVLDKGTVYDLLTMLLRKTRGRRSMLPLKITSYLRRLPRPLSVNSVDRARRNVAHHYDLDTRLYDLFLDADRQYSCAYFEDPNQTLEEAQLAKKRHIAAKLLIEPGSSVLDIGCGWGGLALYLSQVAGAGSVKGITLSEEQLQIARQRATAAGLDPDSFVLEDYRETQGRFDRIVSVGMFEHVGTGAYGRFFDAVGNLLADDGVALIHTIGRTGEPDFTNPWITKYIFPGGHLPTLSEIVPALEKSGLAITDLEVLRLHYAETLRHWRARFIAARDQARALYDERFCRMWECYLAASEASFRHEDLVVFQFQLAKRNNVIPLTRSYVDAREASLRQVEAAAPLRAVHDNRPEEERRAGR